MAVSGIPMSFEFDAEKSASNKLKHGIDFVEAQASAEKRYLVIGTIKRQHWSAVITYRGMTVRPISVRKSTPPEIAACHAKIAS